MGQGVDWHQIITVLEALAVSPILGLVGAGGLYYLLKRIVRTGHLFEPPEEGRPPRLVAARPADPHLHQRQLQPRHQ